MTSHAAVVARGMGRPCVAGAGSITVDYAAAKLTVGSVTVTEGQILTIDGSTGEVMVGEVPTVLGWKMSRISDLISLPFCSLKFEVPKLSLVIRQVIQSVLRCHHSSPDRLEPSWSGLMKFAT